MHISNLNYLVSSKSITDKHYYGVSSNAIAFSGVIPPNKVCGYGITKEAREYLEVLKKEYNFKQTKPIQWTIKRASDYVGAATGLVLTSPLLILSAIAIKLESKGPVIFKQIRTGKDGKIFTLYKFRTMCGTEQNVTKVGRVLRKFSLDEFPQFINMLKGEMSIIGPRPIINSDTSALEKIDPTSIRRLTVLPGAKLDYKAIKGEDLAEKIKVEKEYLDNWNLMADFKILLKILKDIATGSNY